MAGRTTLFVVGAVALIVGATVGLLIGFLSPRRQSEAEKLLDSLTQDIDDSIKDKLMGELNANNIRENLRTLTSIPHMGGTPADLQQAVVMRDQMLDWGLDRAQLYPYDVLLSYPDPLQPSKVQLVTAGGAVVHTSRLKEEALLPEEDHDDVIPPFNAYAKAGTPQGDPVYVNYGRIEDFIYINETAGINLQGKICIARYGKIFRGTKALFAHQFGCAGIVFYSDPADYTDKRQTSSPQVFPDTWFLPGDGVQRGNVWMKKADPLTPGYPSIKSAYRIPQEEAGMPEIPVHPIGYDDASVFLSGMLGDEVPVEWRGSLNFTYRLGPGYVQTSSYIKMTVNTRPQNVTTYNLVGFIEGAVEPDRYILVGNHRDAWVFGGVDPSSGTAVMLELARVYGKLLTEGWRPRRSILFCSWGSEEHGLVGSSEWVEHFTKILSNRAVAYLNIDIAVRGSYSFRAKSAPMMNAVVREVAKHVPNPDPTEIDAGRPTMYDTWRYRKPDPDIDEPVLSLLGSGSDFAPFVGTVGVTCTDLSYTYDSNSGIGSYPVYHSIHDTFYLVNNIIDPTFKFSLAVGQYTGELLRLLADSYIIPFDVRQYSTEITKFIGYIERDHGTKLATHDMTDDMNYLKDASNKLKLATDTFHTIVDEAKDSKNPIHVRTLNDKMMQLERAFIDPLGLPGRQLVRHIVYAPSSFNLYAGAYLPGLLDTIWLAERAPPGEQTQRWEDVKRHLAVVTYFIGAAADSLLESIQF